MRHLLRRMFVPRWDPSRPPGHAVAIPRNVIASLIATATEMVLIPLLVEVFGVYYLYAVMGCMLLATTISFFLNKYWVFEAHRGRAPRQYVKQIIVGAGSFGGNVGLIWVLTEMAGIHYFISFILSNLVVFFGWNYPASRWFVFSDGHRRPASTQAGS